MKLKFIKMKVRSEWRRRAVVIVFALMVSLGLMPAVAQQQSPKRITSVWTTTTAEGSYVTVDSDSPLNDYEAYKRGDRFYVKIPLADLPSARGSLLGRGFDDVQIQRYGDGIILSFRLQPGTTAHVDQKLNRLDVIFSTPGRFQKVGATSVSRDDIGNRTRARRIEDSAGPRPPSANRAQTRSSRSTVRHSASGNGSGHIATRRSGSRSSQKAQPKSSPSIDRTLTLSHDGASAKGAAARKGAIAAAASSPSPQASIDPDRVAPRLPARGPRRIRHQRPERAPLHRRQVRSRVHRRTSRRQLLQLRHTTHPLHPFHRSLHRRLRRAETPTVGQAG